jgi:hypothetical protein
MTNRNKLIVGAVVVLGAFYLYDRSKKMKALAELKAKADAEKVREEQIREDKALATKRPIGTIGLNTITEIV